MKRIHVLLTCLFLFSFGAMAQDFASFGEDFKAKKTSEASELTKMNLDKVNDIQVEGEVNAVCQAKGCWMTVNLDNGETMRVTFKDYGFFVPKNLAGTKVIFKGRPEVSTTSVEELRHYAKDAGKSEEEILAIREPEISLSFVADGVLVPKL
ncbi:MAG: hypothetical protein ACI9IP_000932 [Arcticibacterium sp.]|jgi:hypothetical protein